MPGDEIIQELLVPVPRQGFADGFDPALADGDYPASRAPDLLNIRVGFGRWETRLGMTLYKPIPGSGDIRHLDAFELSDGTRIRLAARGNTTAAALYDLIVGTDTGFNSMTGGTGLGGSAQPYFHGALLNDYYYFTDRFGALRRYDKTNGVATVAQPAQPAAAPGVRARPYANLESWNGNAGVAPFGWTRTNSGRFEITDDSSTYPSPIGGRTVKLSILSTSAAGEDIHENVTAETLNSDTICYWLRQERNRFHQVFEIGLTAAGDLLQQNDRAPSASEWYPVFLNIRGISAINYKRFRCVNATVKADWVTKLVLPGRLSGQYRWFYTHYNPTTGTESKPSAVSNGNAPLDFSMEGVSYKTASAAAINKSAVLTFSSDSGTDSGTTKIRLYRNGGTAALTLDANGQEVWYRVGEVYDQSTTLNGGVSAAGTTITVTAVTNLAVGDTLVLDKGAAAEETVTIAAGGITGFVLTLTEPLASAHSNGATVQIACLDNVPNEAVDTTTPVQKERDDAPAGTFYVQRSPDGRLWLFGPNTKVAVSNRSTPDKPIDYEVFPNGVDPLTRRHPIQGFRFEVGGDTTDEQIMWGGFFNGVATILTRRHLYQVYAYSQADWGPNAVQKVHNVGCIAGDTVQEVNGQLFWVADGPRVMRWDGQTPPVSVSAERINQTLSDAPTGYWANWFARYHAKQTGHYYCLFLTPTGATTNTLRLDYNAGIDAWEPCAYNDSTATRIAWRGAVVLDGGSDARELYQAGTDANVYQVETGTTDNGNPIAIRFSTKKFTLQGYLGRLHTALLRLAAVTDSVTLTFTAGGGEYGTLTDASTQVLNGSGDLELYQRIDRNLIGRWAQITVAGSVSNRPAFRDFVLRWQPLRSSRYGR